VQEVSTYNVEKVFVYDVFGQMAAEYSLGAQSLPCTTCYIATDHLGSTRMVTDQNANVVGRHDYLPFGEEIAANTGGRNGLFGTQDFVNQKFTGQERDSETGLDFFQARYFSGALGRFNSPDPENAGASLFNPQSWNAYSYVRTNPLVLIDPTGMCDSKDPSCFSIDKSACKWWQVWCWAGGSSGSESADGAFDPIIPLSLCCQYVTGEPSGPVEQQRPSPDFRSSTSIAPNNGTRNCSATPASAGQYAAATAQVALLTGQFFSGLGSADQNFGPNTATSQVMAQSGPVQDALNDYSVTGRTSNLYTFGAGGYVAAGANPVAQFVGSFRYTISPTNGGINLRLTNTSSFKSLTYDKGPQWQRGRVPTPMSNTHQVYNIFVPCGG
jgi:RHS repeat-associated protein